MRTAALKRSMSNLSSARLNFIRFNEARLHAVLLTNTYSLHGFVEWIGSVPLQVCHFWIAPSYWMPGSPQMCVPSAILVSNVAASFFWSGMPLTLLVHHSLPDRAASKNSSL